MHYLISIILFICCTSVNSHSPGTIAPNKYPILNYDTLLPTTYQGRNKFYAVPYQKPIITALKHFPELNAVKIRWRVKETYVPLSTKPDFWSMFRQKSKRSYIITISEHSIDTLRHLLYKNLPFDAQVGIMGHELSHVADFRSKSTWQSLISAIQHLSPSYLDKVEFATDKICIQHGLGMQLLAYSSNLRKIMHVHNWRGVDYVLHNDGLHQRYMNPDTIKKFMQAMH